MTVPRTSPASPVPAAAPDVDVLIVGAGISGIGAGCHLKTRLPGKTFLIVDARERIGGTWDLFRYPGVRSDSDLHTFCYEFKPWAGENALADGEEILAYLAETIQEHDLAPHLQLGCKVLAANWSSRAGCWTVQVLHSATGEVSELTCRWLFSAAGYYDYDRGYRPYFTGEEHFGGQIIHPQQWPAGLRYDGRQVVVIGSGATAVTLVPAMAASAAHVTMLQRSPGYVLPVPARDPVANGLRRVLPATAAYRVTRRLTITRERLIYSLSQRYPALVRRLIRWVNKRMLPGGYDVDAHFSPRYNPWDQRLCAVRDGDLFRAIRAGSASVVTGQIARFTEHGVELQSGQLIMADIVVTATGLRLLPFGGISLSVDGTPVPVADTVAFKSMLLSGVPNFAFAFGYTNSSWTLKVDLVCEHLCRLIAHMDASGYQSVTPDADDPSLQRRPFLNFSAGYVTRGIARFPKQGSHGPWTQEMSYAADRARLRKGPVEDPALRFATITASTDDELTAGRGGHHA